MTSYQEHGLKLHNWYRKRHGAPKMVLVERLNDAADAYAMKLARRQQLVHNSGLDYGENLYMSWGRQGSEADHVADACKSWYNEIQQYSFGHPGFSGATGHFTAMVWKGSTQLGIGIAEVNGCVCVVANYKPWPNVQGQFGSNVLQFRDVEDSDDEEVKEKKRQEQEAEKARQEAEAEKSAEEQTKNDADLPAPVRDSFDAAKNDDGEIGWQELKDILTLHVKVRSKFEGFDKTLCYLLISLMTVREGEKSTVGAGELANILKCVEAATKAFSEFDVDRSGSLDPFEFKSAAEEAGFRLSYKTFQTLQRALGDDKGNMSMRAHVLCFLLLSKLQVLMEARSEAGGMFEDFSLKDWITEELENASVE